jgi:hypothetical protein
MIYKYFGFRRETINVHFTVFGFTRSTSLVEQELRTIPEHLSSPPVSVGFVLLDLYSYMYVL